MNDAVAGLVWLLASVAAVSAGLLVWCLLAEARDRHGVHRESRLHRPRWQRMGARSVCWTAVWESWRRYWALVWFWTV